MDDMDEMDSPYLGKPQFQSHAVMEPIVGPPH